MLALTFAVNVYCCAAFFFSCNAGTFQKLPLESVKDVERRSQAYTNCWTEFKQRIDVCRRKMSRLEK